MVGVGVEVSSTQPIRLVAARSVKAISLAKVCVNSTVFSLMVTVGAIYSYYSWKHSFFIKQHPKNEMRIYIQADQFSEWVST